MLFSVAKNALLPADNDARAVFEAERIGTQLDMLITNKDRRFAYAAIGRLAKAYGFSTRTMRDYFAIKAGYFDAVPDETGRKIIIAKSVSDMSEAAFQAYWDDAEAPMRALLPLLPPEDAQEILSMLTPAR